MFPTVIRTRDDFELLRTAIALLKSYAVPIWTDNKAHPAVNTLSVLFIYIDSQWVIFSTNHNEAPHLPVEWLEELVPFEMHTPLKKDLLYLISRGNIVDCAESEYVKNGIVTFPESAAIQEFERRHSDIKNINKAVPMMKLLELADAYRIDWGEGINGFISQTAISVYHWIESAGLRIIPEKFVKHYRSKTAASHIADGYVYSMYNPYHITGRPSNNFGDVSYSAIPKHDGTREAFISRFSGGKLVMMDFESFHLRLIAHMINFPQPKEPFHQYLGKIYYNKNELTEEEYKTAKSLTFEYIYGNTPKPDIPFFVAMNKWLKEYYNEVFKMGYLPTSSGRTIPLSTIEDPSTYKVFNYKMQSEEMYQTINRLSEVKDMFEHNKLKSKVVLYVYDSILMDISPEDDTSFVVNATKQILEQGGFPVRVYEGPDYHNLTLIP